MRCCNENPRQSGDPISNCFVLLVAVLNREDRIALVADTGIRTQAHDLLFIGVAGGNIFGRPIDRARRSRFAGRGLNAVKPDAIIAAVIHRLFFQTQSDRIQAVAGPGYLGLLPQANYFLDVGLGRFHEFLLTGARHMD